MGSLNELLQLLPPQSPIPHPHQTRLPLIRVSKAQKQPTKEVGIARGWWDGGKGEHTRTRAHARAHSWRPWGNACEPGREGTRSLVEGGWKQKSLNLRLEMQSRDGKGECHTPGQGLLTAQLLARKAEPAGAAGQARSFLSPPTPGSGHDPERPRPASKVELSAQE